MPEPATVNPLCTWEDITDRIGQAGAALRVDDDPSTMNSVLVRATVKVLGYLFLNYHDANSGTINGLAASNWVKEATADVGAYLLCKRRAHTVPSSIADDYKERITELKQLMYCQTQLPDVAQSKANVPVMSNQRITLWPFPRVVSVEGKSTGNAENYDQFTDTTDQFDYSI